MWWMNLAGAGIGGIAYRLVAPLGLLPTSRYLFALDCGLITIWALAYAMLDEGKDQ